MLKSKHFTSEQQLLDWANENVRCGDIISINYVQSWERGVRDDDKPGEAPHNWVLFYCE